MIDKSKYHRSLWEAMAVHSLFIDLGYRKEEIFIFITPNGVIIELQAEGKKLPIRVGPAEYPLDCMLQKLKELSQEWNSGGTITTDEKDENFHTSQAKRMVPQILAGLVALDFKRWQQSPNKYKYN